jgi:hypothetical protein
VTTADPSSAVGSAIIFENDHVRVWEMNLEPGQACEMHQHHHDHVIIYPMPGTMRARHPGDQEWTIRQDTRAGFVMHRTVGNSDNLLPHQLMNAGTETVIHYIVELLGPTATSDPVDDTNSRAILGRLPENDTPPGPRPRDVMRSGASAPGGRRGAVSRCSP